MSRRGETPPIPPPSTPAIEIWTNEKCTVRPTSGQIYNDLFAKVNRSYQFNEGISYGTSVPNICDVFTPDEEFPEDEYYVGFSEDWTSTSQESPIEPGVYRLQTQPGGTLLNATVFDYGTV